MKKNIFKKLFIKISKLVGYELIDQNEFYSPTLEKNLDEKKIKINNYENKLAKIFTKNIKEI